MEVVSVLFNTHSHVDTNHRFEADREAVLARAREMGVSHLMVVGFNLESIPISVRFADQHEGVFAAVGIHPTDAQQWSAEVAEMIREAARSPKVRAIGEIGLDYYWKDYAPFEVQRDVFREQLRLARQLTLPVVIHDRDAHGDVVRILREEKADEVGGIMHCFAGDWEIAQQCMDLGLHLGVGGTVTFKSNAVLQDVVRRMPLERLVLETDDPYLSPVPFRGKRNEPGYVHYVAEFVAQLRNIGLDEIERATLDNARRVLRIEQ